MRLLLAMLFLPLFALQVHAQPAPAAPPAPPQATAAPTVEAPAAPRATKEAKHRRMSWQQRFAQANTAHDGHLTLQQAEAGYKTVARHFRQIDAEKKGYVTVEDVNNWHKLQRAMRHSHHERTLQPRPAMQQGVMQPRRINASSTATVVPMTSSDSVANGGTIGAQR